MASFAGVRSLVVGLGRFGGGVSVTRWLAEQGARVTVTDQADASALTESLEAIADLPVTLKLGRHDPQDLKQTDLVIINPAVHKLTSGLFKEICHQKIPWTTEMNLFCERCKAPVLGVTGSYGKSTTSAMLAHVLGQFSKFAEKEPFEVHLGGNIGRSLLLDLPRIRAGDFVVLEMSNAQLEDIGMIRWQPAMAVITNLHPHHLDRYVSFEGYVQAKLNLVRAGEAFPVVIGDMDPLARRLLEEVIGRDRHRLKEVAQDAVPVPLAIPGRHNQANAACVLTACEILRVDGDMARESLKSFRGLPHRLELVRTHGGIRFINDSKSTAPAATVTALRAVAESLAGIDPTTRPHSGPDYRMDPVCPVVAIVGGQRKDVALDECARELARSCRAVVCLGESGPAFAGAVRAAAAASGIAAGLIVEETHDLTEAVRFAARTARSGDVVLFSPGAPSFDQFANFTDRGRKFMELVENLQAAPDNSRARDH